MSLLRSLQMKLANTLGASHLMPASLRIPFYRLCGLRLEAKSMRAKIFFYSPQVTIGSGSFINSFVQFHSGYSVGGRIALGKNCFVAMNVSFITQSHDLGASDKRAGLATESPITIGDGVWIGANATILPGVTIGDGCVIAAGAVVTGHCAANMLYGGVPARELKSLDVGAATDS